MVLAARSMSESSRIWGSSAVIAATVGSMALTSRSFLVPKTLGRKVSIKDIKGPRYGRNPQVPFYSVKRDARWGRVLARGHYRETCGIGGADPLVRGRRPRRPARALPDADVVGPA